MTLRLAALLLALSACTSDDDSGAPAVAAPAAPAAARRTAAPSVHPAAVAAPVDPDAVAAERAAAEAARVDVWIVRHGGLEYLAGHRMERGETALALSRAIGVPVWVLRGVNATQDLDHLEVGDWVQFPVTPENREPAAAWVTEEDWGC